MAKQQEHIVKSYDEELQRLQGEILRMGGLAGEQLKLAMQALQDGDVPLARKVIAADERIDVLELEVSGDVLRLLARRQPMATDLRVVLSSLRIAAAIERIGDYAANIAKRSLALPGTSPPAPIHGLSEMARYAENMLRDVLDAFLHRDTDRAMVVRESDLELDHRYNVLLKDLLTSTMADASNIGTCVHCLFIAKNLERIGDHITTIAENVWFQTEGELPLEERSKADTTNVVPGG